MPIQFQCPKCGKQLNAPDSAAGVTGPCPFCKATITAPRAPGAPATAPASQPPGLPPAPSPAPSPLGAPSPGGPALSPLGGPAQSPAGRPPWETPAAPPAAAASSRPAWETPVGQPASRLSYGQEAQDDDISGLNWGAFFLTWIWGISHGVWITLLCFVPLIDLIMRFVLLIKGNEWAWEKRAFSNVDEFRQVQRAWMVWGIITIPVGMLCLIPVGAAVLFPVFAQARAKAREASARQVLKSLQMAEQSSRTSTGRYATLSELKQKSASPVGDGEEFNGYTFKSVAGPTGYTVVATPPSSRMGTFTLAEPGGLTGGRSGP